jgi:hypothetical protein
MLALYELLIGSPKPTLPTTHPAVRRVVQLGMQGQGWKTETAEERDKRLALNRQYQKTYYATHKQQILERHRRYRRERAM